MSKSVKFRMLLSVLILSGVFFMYPRTSLATPPQDMKLSYDSKVRVLTVTITHKSFFPSLHYIKLVEIKKNGNLLSDNKYDKQPADDTFTYNYSVTAAPGDTIQAKASCNLYGSRTVDLTVGKQMP